MRLRRPVDLNSHMNENVTRGNPADFGVVLRPVFLDGPDGQRPIRSRRAIVSARDQRVPLRSRLRVLDHLKPTRAPSGDLQSMLEPFGNHCDVFVEITKSEHQHGGPGWEFGQWLWSPIVNRGGSDRYALMRDPRPGDLVLHFYETDQPGPVTESRVCGRSYLAAQAEVVNHQPPSPGTWAGLGSYYRIALRDHQAFPNGVALTTSTDTYGDEIRAEIQESAPRYFPFNRYGDGVRTVQGIYLARCTERLYSTFARALDMEIAGAAAPEELHPLRVEFAEGRRMARQRYYFARNPALVRAAKDSYGYRCQACNFNFEERYGQLGIEYIEVHHLNPLSERAEAEWSAAMTRLEEVTVVCANCHRMLHRRRPALSLDELRPELR